MLNYLKLGQKILSEGERVGDRTGTGTISLFGEQLKFDLREGFPIVTTKKVNLKPLIRELLWFLRGEDNTATLGSKIWDAWRKPAYGYPNSKRLKDWIKKHPKKNTFLMMGTSLQRV